MVAPHRALSNEFSDSLRRRVISQDGRSSATRSIFVNAGNLSRQEMEAELGKRCGAQVRGDTYRNLNVKSTFLDSVLSTSLFRLVLTYNYGVDSYQVVVNGVTGRSPAGTRGVG